MPVIGRRRHAEVNTAIQTQVFTDLIREPRIHRADPIRILFRAYAAEEFGRKGKFSNDWMPNADRVVELGMVATARPVSVEAECGLKAHVPTRNIKEIGDPQATFGRVISEVSRAQGQFHKWNERQRKESTVVAHEVQLETRCDAIEARVPLSGPHVAVVRFFPLVRRIDQLEVE